VKTKIITVTQNQADRIEQILQETIIGPSDKTEYYPHPWVQRECLAMSFNPKLGRAIEVQDLANIVSLENGGGLLDNNVEILIENGTFIFNQSGEKFLSLPTALEEHALPMVLSPPLPLQRQEITLQFVGGSDGFDPEGITTCFLAYFGATGYESPTLFDAAAYLRIRLGHLGISPRQISEVVISHLHEDHIAGLPELLLMGECRVKILTTHTIHRSLLRVLSALLNVPKEEASALFDFYPLLPGKDRMVNGKNFSAIYAIHTIPTIAVRVSGLYYSGDTRYDEEWFDNLLADNILSEARREELSNFAKGARILVQDAGGGTIHTTLSPNVLDALTAKSKHVILTHAPKSDHHLPYKHKSSPNIIFAEDGHVSAVGESFQVDGDAEKLATISACPLYARLSISERVSLTRKVTLITWTQQEKLIDYGQPSDGRAYIVHRGLVEVWENEKRIQVLGRGASIGERGCLTGEPRSSTVIAHANAQLLELSNDVFNEMADRLGLEAAYARVDKLWKHPIFKHLPWATLLDLALDFQPLSLPTGRLLFEYGTPGFECYLLISGEITLIDKNLNKLGIFDRSGEFFGGRSVLFDTNRNASACISKDSEIWALPAPAIKRLQMVYPNVILHLRSVEANRHGQSPFLSAFDFNQS
jgi:CRP-like cAMP-binding protein/ribonuclease BN (tRNA processing enzyme)